MINYNFYDLFRSIDTLKDAVLKDSTKTSIEQCCSDIAAELAKFFTDTKCNEVHCTLNTDKEFFGLFINPLYFGVDIPKIYTEEDISKLEIRGYSVDIDSKLFTDLQMLSTPEITTLILCDINSMISRKSVDIFRAAVDYVYATKDISCLDTNMICNNRYNSCLTMITKICTYNLNSILHKSYEELNSVSIPDFVQGYNLTEHYTGLIDKLIGVSDKTAQEYPLLLLNWFLDCYHNEDSYIPTVLKKSLEMEPSSGIRKLILTAMGSILEYGVADYQKLQSLTESKKGLIAQMKRNGLRSIEEDLYEYNMRLRNVDTQDDAILLMRQINSRMSILEEYLRNDTDIDEKDKQRWESCLNSYMQLRSDLTKKTVYNKKMYGLFVDYNALQSMSQNNQMMNTYY